MYAPSPLNYATFKAGVKDTLIADFEATMANIPWATGFSPERWKTGTNIMLDKKSGNFHTTKVRTILLYQADFNMTNKITGRRLMKNSEFFSTIPPEQYGS